MLAASSTFLAFSAPPVYKTPTVEIGSSGVRMPLVGIGTWQYNDSVTEAALLTALKMGYEHIDTAAGYKNAKGVAAALEKSGRKRESYFLTSKIPGGMNETAATTAIEENLKELKVEYVDLMLVHYPATWTGEGGKAMRQATWKALEAAVAKKQARAIGVSHYCRQHVEDVLEIAKIKPAINQVEYHVGMGTEGANATDDKVWLQEHGITFQSFSPLCGPCGEANHMELITGKLVSSIGKKYGKSGAQVALKWQVQQEIPVIPKAQNPTYQKEDLDLFDGWTLSEEDFAALTQAVTPPVTGGGGDGTSGDCKVP